MSDQNSLSDDPMLPTTSARSRATSRGRTAQEIRAGRSHRLQKTGIYSTVGIKEAILDEVHALYARASWLDPVQHGPLVESLGRMLVRLRRLDDALDGPEPSRDMLALAARLEGQVRLTCEALGLSPRSAAALGLAHLDGAAKARIEAEKALARYAPPARKRARS